MKKRMWLCVALCALLVWTSVPSLAEDCFTIDVDALDMNSLNSDEYVAQYLSASAQGVRVRKYISDSSELAAPVRLTLMQMDSQTLLFDKDYGLQSGTFDSGVIYLPYVADRTIPYLVTLTDEDWRRMLDVNLSGAFYVTRAVLPGMISLKSGSIVNVSSVWGQVGASCEVHYSAAKAGLIGLTRALAKEVGPSGVTVNCVCPGVIQTDMLGDFTGSDLAALAEETPLGRLGTPQEVAAAILWLCQGDAAFVTGQVIGVGGGFGA